MAAAEKTTRVTNKTKQTTVEQSDEVVVVVVVEAVANHEVEGEGEGAGPEVDHTSPR